MQRFKHAWSEGALLAPAIILLLIFIIAPFVLSGYLSFTNERLIPRPIPTQWVGWLNYRRVLTDPYFWQAVHNTLYFTILVVPFQCALALGVALLLNKKLAGLSFFRSIAMLPLLAPITVVIAIWAALYQVPNGFLNTVVNLVTGDDRIIDFLRTKELAMQAIVL
ncbi:MAG: sugar ABC transporter permease [Pseudohongiellaceae bacterium]